MSDAAKIYVESRIRVSDDPADQERFAFDAGVAAERAAVLALLQKHGQEHARLDAEEMGFSVDHMAIVYALKAVSDQVEGLVL